MCPQVTNLDCQWGTKLSLHAVSCGLAQPLRINMFSFLCHAIAAVSQGCNTNCTPASCLVLATGRLTLPARLNSDMREFAY